MNKSVETDGEKNANKRRHSPSVEGIIPMPSLSVNRQTCGTIGKARHGFFRSAPYTGEETENISGIGRFADWRDKAFLNLEGRLADLRFDALGEDFTLIGLLHHLYHIKRQIQGGFASVTPGSE